jgi:ADP-ribose pyrophosphatase YjhB (NUDIX family)
MQKGVNYIGIAMVPFLHDGAGNYLVGLRTDKCRDEHHTWEPLGGGAVIFGESISDAIVREVKEETGAEPFNLEYLGHREVFREHSSTPTHWIAFDYKAEVDRASVKIMEPDKCAEIRWCTIANLPDPLHSQFPLFLERYRDTL